MQQHPEPLVEPSHLVGLVASSLTRRQWPQKRRVEAVPRQDASPQRSRRTRGQQWRLQQWCRRRWPPVAVTAIHTPPTRPSAVTPPSAMEPPSAGCGTEDLRLWMLQVVKAQERDMTSLEIRIASQVNGITQTLGDLSKESQAGNKDVGVFSAIKYRNIHRA